MIIDLTYVKARIRYRALLELTDDSENSQGKINDTKLQQAITDVEYKVNNALRKHYVIPLTQLNNETDAYNDSVGTVKHLALKCVMHTLYFQANIEEIPEAYINAFVELEEIEKGVAVLYGCKQTSSVAVASNKVSTDKIYSPELLSTI